MNDVSTRFEDLTEQQQIEIAEFIRENFIPTNEINLKHSAYWLKQRFSRTHFYLTQEQFTQAMERAGFRVQLLEQGNACFNISEKSPYLK